MYERIQAQASGAFRVAADSHHTHAPGMERTAELIRELYRITGELREIHGRNFTPDGHLVGDIGEAIAAVEYNLELLPPSTPLHDAKTRDGRLVQVKCTQGNVVALRGDEPPEVLLILRLLDTGGWTEIYHGPGADVWHLAGKKGSNGQRPLSLSKLRR